MLAVDNDVGVLLDSSVDILQKLRVHFDGPVVGALFALLVFGSFREVGKHLDESRDKPIGL